MMRLIDADALIAAFLDYPKMLTFNGGFCAVNLDAVLLEIRKAPTIEAEPVRHGRWVFEEDEVHPWLTKAICSNCEKVAEKSSHLQFRIGKKTFLHDHTYCPNCGAKMDGDSHDSL
jgi:hypothetical protein